MIKKILCFVGVVAALLSIVLVPVSAIEYSVDNTIVPYDPILDQYPYSNMLPFPYRFKGTTVVSGITITSGSDYYLTFDGISSAVSYNVISRMNLPVGTYTLTGCPFGSTADMWTVVRTPQGNNYRNGDKITFNVVNETDLIEVLVCVANGYVVDLVSFRPMLSKGSTPFEWSPYLPYVFDQYIDEGKADGYEEGYEQGMNDLYDQAASSQLNAFDPLSGVTLSCYSEQEDNSLNFTLTEIPIVLNPTGYVRFDRAMDYVMNWWYNEHPSTDFRPLNIEFTFSWPRMEDMPVDYRITPMFQNEFILSTTRAPNDMFAILTLENGVSYQNVSLVPGDESYAYVYNTTQYSGDHFVEISVSWTFYDGDQTIDFLYSTLLRTDAYAPNMNFILGYMQGAGDANKDVQIKVDQAYQQGENSGLMQGKDEGLAEGYQNGYIQGKKDGFHIVDDGSFVNLFTAVADAPVRSILGLLDFEVLGLDMRTAFGSLIVVCLVIIFLKKVI